MNPSPMLSRRRMLGLSAAVTLAALVGCGSSSGSKKVPKTKDPSGPSENIAADDPAAATYLTGQQDFAAKMLNASAGAGKPNAVVSAFSIAQALAMTGQGAAGQTLDELAGVLGCTSAAELANGANAQLTSLAQKKQAEINVANASFVSAKLAVKDDYAAALAAYFGVAAHQVPFEEDPSGSRDQINGWVSERTKDKIPELLGDGQITEDTRIVLVNAVYLLAMWEKQFKPEKTHDGEFFTPDGAVDVDMMHDDRTLEYADRDGTITIRLPYEDDGFAAYVVMPPEGDLDFLLEQVDGAGLDGMIDRLDEVEAKLSMPRFEARQRIELSEILQGLGVELAFTGDADFSGLSDDPTKLSFVQHEAWIKVGEKGTEAAAATASGGEAGAAPGDDPVVVTIDHPFLFLVRDDETGTTLFSAVVRDPSAAPAD